MRFTIHYLIFLHELILRVDDRVLTLGTLLYTDSTTGAPLERDFVALLQRVATRDASALQLLFQLTHQIVFTSSLRITASRDAAEELTVDVFHEVWRNTAEYDPADGSVLGWIMNRIHARANDRNGDLREPLDEAGRSSRLKAALAILEAPRSPGHFAHESEHSQLVFAYFLQTLPVDGLSAAQANLSACAECREELDWLRAVSDALVYWPTDLVRPSAPLWDRLARRILAEARVPPDRAARQAWTEPEWKEAAPGISVQLLAIDPEKDRVSMLVRLAPGAHYPPHRHAGVEELHLLSGELVVDEKKLFPGGYLRSESGSADQLVWSETGCTCFLTTSVRDELR